MFRLVKGGASGAAPPSASHVELAHNELGRTRMLKHPDVLRFVDGDENEAGILLVTERVVPLEMWVRAQPRDTEEDEARFQAGCVWGVHSIASALSFLNNDCSMVHGSVSPDSVFVTRSGQWKLGRLGTVQEESSDWPGFLRKHDIVAPEYRSPEAEEGWSNSGATGAGQDAWGLASVIKRVLDGPVRDSRSISRPEGVPRSLQPVFRRMISRSPTARINPREVLESEYFDSVFVKCMVFIDNLALKDERARSNFFQRLPAALPAFPPDACRYKVLPVILESLSVGAGTTMDMLEPMLQIASMLPADEFEATVAPTVVELFKRPDRATRMQLLTRLPNFADNMDSALLNGQIFPSIVTGFTDTDQRIRLATVQVMPVLAPKLQEKLQLSMLKFLKKTLTDAVPGIRVNTAICLGMIAPQISSKKREGELFPCFARAVRDPYPHVRVAAVRAIGATLELFNETAVATQIMPRVVPVTVDPWRDARDAACEALRLFAEHMVKVSESRAAAEEDAKRATEPEGTKPEAARGGAGVSVIAGSAGGAVAGALGWLAGSPADAANSPSGGVPPRTVADTQAGALSDDPSTSRGGRPVASAPASGGAGTSVASAPASRSASNQANASADESGWGGGDGWGEDGWDDIDASTAKPASIGLRTSQKTNRTGGLGARSSTAKPAGTSTASTARTGTAPASKSLLPSADPESDDSGAGDVDGGWDNDGWGDISGDLASPKSDSKRGSAPSAGVTRKALSGPQAGFDAGSVEDEESPAGAPVRPRKDSTKSPAQQTLGTVKLQGSKKPVDDFFDSWGDDNEDASDSAAQVKRVGGGDAPRQAIGATSSVKGDSGPKTSGASVGGADAAAQRRAELAAKREARRKELQAKRDALLAAKKAKRAAAAAKAAGATTRPAPATETARGTTLTQSVGKVAAAAPSAAAAPATAVAAAAKPAASRGATGAASATRSPSGAGVRAPARAGAKAAPATARLGAKAAATKPQRPAVKKIPAADAGDDDDWFSKF